MWKKVREEFVFNEGEAFIYPENEQWILDIDGHPNYFYYTTDKRAMSSYEDYLKTGHICDDTEDC